MKKYVRANLAEKLIAWAVNDLAHYYGVLQQAYHT